MQQWHPLIRRPVRMTLAHAAETNSGATKIASVEELTEGLGMPEGSTAEATIDGVVQGRVGYVPPAFAPWPPPAVPR